MNETSQLYKLVIYVLSSISSLIVQYFNPSINMLQALGICIALDFVIGLWHSYTVGVKFSPRKFLGKLKELGIFIVVLFAAIAINPLWKHYGIAEQWMANSFIGAYGFYHFFSVLQNAGKMGFPLAGYFQKFIESKVTEISDMNKKEVKEVAIENKE